MVPDITSELQVDGDLSVFKCLYRAGRGGFVRVGEGIKASSPGHPCEGPWSGRRDPYIRNVEAVGSNPITSTKSPGQRLESGNSGSSTSAHERYVEFVEVGGLSPISHSESPGHEAGGVLGACTDSLTKTPVPLSD